MAQQRTSKASALTERVRRLYGISLYRNAAYLMLHSGSSALLGFVFWIMVARLYAAKDVGLASAAVSAATILALVANLGLGFGLIRFLATAGEKANSLINSCFTLGGLASVVAALIFLGGLSIWSPALLFLRQNPAFFVAFVAFTVAFNLIVLVGDVFVAERRASFTLANSLIHGLLRIPLAIILALAFHAFGIFVSWTVSMMAALLISVLVLLPRVRAGYRPRLIISRGPTSEMIRFSFANYIATLFLTASGSVLPIMVVNVLSAETNAYFYLAWAMGSALFAVTGATSLSLFAEGSHDEQTLSHNIRRTLKFTYLILVPAVLVVLALADRLLLLSGTAYSESATTLLRLLALSSLPLALNNIYLGIKRVEKKLGVILALTVLIAAATPGLSYVLLPHLGINGVGIAHLSIQGAIALGIMARWLRGPHLVPRLGTILLPTKES